MWGGGGGRFGSCTCIWPLKNNHLCCISQVRNFMLIWKHTDLGKSTIRSAVLSHSSTMTTALWGNNFTNTANSRSDRVEPSSLSVPVEAWSAQTHFPLHRSRSCLWFQLLLCQEVLKELIHWPGDGGGGHLVYNPSLDPFEEGRQTTKPVHCPEGVSHSR